MKSFHAVFSKTQANLAIFCCLAMVSCNQQKDFPGTRSDLEKLGLKGKVKSLTETTYKGVRSMGENSQRDPEIRESVFFNEKGNITGKIYHFYSSGFTSRTTCEYDRNGNLTEEKILNDKGEELQRTTCWYDEKGRITERIKTDFKMISQNIEVFRYDENGRETERKNREYRAGGRIITYVPGPAEQKPEVQRDEGKDVWITVTSGYDDKGNKTEEKYYSSDGRLRSRDTFRYDDKGRIIEASSY
ncbi:MAG: hypothetical protein QUS12_01715, partial [Methanosarcina sp.]|nr:hypothetical protein [Methanosarcina sp.]